MKIKNLKESCQKENVEPLVVRLQRPLGLIFSIPFIKLKMQPNHITNLMTAVGIISSIFFISGQYWWSIVGIVLWNVQLMLDLVDGNVARYFKKTSKKGVYLDAVSHTTAHPLLWFCIGFGLCIKNVNFIYLMLPGFLVWFNSSTLLLRKRMESLIPDTSSADQLKDIKQSKNIFIFIARNSYLCLNDFFHQWLTLFVIINQLEIFMIFHTVFSFVKFIGLGYYVYPRKVHQYDLKVKREAND